MDVRGISRTLPCHEGEGCRTKCQGSALVYQRVCSRKLFCAWPAFKRTLDVSLLKNSNGGNRPKTHRNEFVWNRKGSARLRLRIKVKQILGSKRTECVGHFKTFVGLITIFQLWSWDIRTFVWSKGGWLSWTVYEVLYIIGIIEYYWYYFRYLI